MNSPDEILPDPADPLSLAAAADAEWQQARDAADELRADIHHAARAKLDVEIPGACERIDHGNPQKLKRRLAELELAERMLRVRDLDAAGQRITAADAAADECNLAVLERTIAAMAAKGITPDDTVTISGGRMVDARSDETIEDCVGSLHVTGNLLQIAAGGGVGFVDYTDVPFMTKGAKKPVCVYPPVNAFPADEWDFVEKFPQPILDPRDNVEFEALARNYLDYDFKRGIFVGQDGDANDGDVIPGIHAEYEEAQDGLLSSIAQLDSTLAAGVNRDGKRVGRPFKDKERARLENELEEARQERATYLDLYGAVFGEVAVARFGDRLRARAAAMAETEQADAEPKRDPRRPGQLLMF